MILVLSAMQEELAEIAAACSNAEDHVHGYFRYKTGVLAGKSIALVQSGVGKVQAAACTQSMIEHVKPTALIFTGLAGSLRSSVVVGDTIVASDCVQYDMDASGLGFARGEIPYTEYRFFACDPQLVSQGSRYKPAIGKVHIGRICTGDQFMDAEKRETMAYLTGDLDGIAVEMEGAAVGLICLLNKVPFLLVRTISDMADGAAPESFAEFLPQASANSLAFLNYLLPTMKA